MADRDSARRRQRKLASYPRRVAERKERGLCVKCGKCPPAPERSICVSCNEKARAAERARADRLRAEGKPLRDPEANRLSEIAKLLTSKGRPLLKRLVEAGGPVSALTQKLALGGATPSLIEQARNLEANARHHRFVQTAQKFAPEEALVTDLHERIRTYAETAGAVHASSPQPAIAMWSHLLDRFGAHAAAIDQHNLVRADPMLLMGESCILSDECVFDWGRS